MRFRVLLAAALSVAAATASAGAQTVVPPRSVVLAIGAGATATGANVTINDGAQNVLLGIINPSAHTFTPAGLAAEITRAQTAEGSSASSIAAEAATARTNEGANASATTAEATTARGNEALALQKSANLSDLASAAAARTSLGLGTAATQTSILDAAFGSARGTILYRGVAAWSALSPGSLGNVLVSGGVGADPSWTPAGAGTVTSVGTGGGLIGGPITSTGTVSAASVTPQGRLTLASGTPVVTTTVTAATSVYYTPYTGNVISLWNGTAFVATTYSEYAQALSDTTYSPSAAVASTCYDEFAWNASGTVRVTRGPAWSAGTGGSNTQRGTGVGSTALTRVQGVLVNANAITNGPAAGFGTFVGTFCTDAGGATVTWNLGSSAAGGGVATLNLWNMYNRVSVTPTVQDSTASWAYATAAYRSADNSVTNRINIVLGLAEDGLQASYSVEANITSGTAFGAVGVGLDKTNGYNGVSGVFGGVASFAQPIAQYAGNPLGQHFLQAIEYGGTNITFFGNGTQLLTATLRM